MAIDYTTPAGQVRLLVADVDETTPVLTDGQLAAYLTLEGGVVKLAAAAALEAIAVSEVLVSKVIRTQDLAADGAKVSAELRARAKDLRQQAADEEDAAGDDAFAVVEYGHRHHPELTNWTW